MPRPFFERPAETAPGAGRLLLVSYHFPPGQAAGAMRWQKFARHAAERGWGLDVITLDPRCIECSDPSRLSDLPQGVRVYGVPVEEHSIRRFVGLVSRARRGLLSRVKTGSQSDPNEGAGSPQPGWVRRQDLVMSPHSPRSWYRSLEAVLQSERYRTWARRVAKLGLQIIAPGEHRLVVSCGPPHMAHAAGRRISIATDLPFVMDLRDPWSLAERWPESVASPTSVQLANHFESRAVRRASLVVMNTGPARAAMQARYPEDAAKIIAVMNGYDDDELPPPQSSHFLVVYTGSIYIDRDPSTLFRAAARVVRKLDLEPSEFGIAFMGSMEKLGGQSVDQLAAREGLAEFVSIHPPGTHREAIELLSRATVLVNLPQDSHLCIPSKVFEYMRHEAWLLALAEPGSATEIVLRETDADIVAPDDVDEIAAVLSRRYRQHQQGDLPRPIASDDRWSRRAQARRLFEAIEGIAAPVRKV